MPTPAREPEREALIEATSRIVCAVIESGKQLHSLNATDVAEYFSQIYKAISQSVKKLN